MTVYWQICVYGISHALFCSNASVDPPSLNRYVEECERGTIDVAFRARLSAGAKSVPLDLDTPSPRLFILEKDVGQDAWFGDILLTCRERWPEKGFNFLLLSRRLSPDGKIVYGCKRSADFIRARAGARKSGVTPRNTLFRFPSLSAALDFSVSALNDVLDYTVCVDGDQVAILAAPPEIIDANCRSLSFRIPGDAAGCLNNSPPEEGGVAGFPLCVFSGGYFHLIHHDSSPSFKMARALRHLSPGQGFLPPDTGGRTDGQKVCVVCRPGVPGRREEAAEFERYLENCAGGEIDAEYRMTFLPPCSPGGGSRRDATYFTDESIGGGDFAGMDRDTAIAAVLCRCRAAGKKIRFAEMERRPSPSGKLLYSLRRNEDFERASKIVDQKKIERPSAEGRDPLATTLLASLRQIPAKHPGESWSVTIRGDTIFVVSAPIEIWSQYHDVRSARLRYDAAKFLDLRKLPTSLPEQGVGCAYTNGALYLIDEIDDPVSGRLFDLFITAPSRRPRATIWREPTSRRALSPSMPTNQCSTASNTC